MGKQRRLSEESEINMTPMIDVVFQMIIFFVCTIQLEKQSLDETIVLADSPNGPTVVVKEPGTVTVEVDRKGQISIARRPLTIQQFQGVMQKTIAMQGRRVPVVIRADGRTQHQYVSRVMDACKQMGFWKVKFLALKDKAKTANKDK